ncbi:hypothetical protein C8T65DRAFT_274144 [Cerioporus squamosus]|nr:hypothetical protein C8T65DRAFT_274144 [Cerioporus squamosus]
MPNIYSLPEEVIIRICSYVVVKHPVGFIEDQKSLARLARACRALSLPALTILWHTLPNILPLLSTLPVDLCVRETLPPLNGNGLPQVYFGFARVPTSADFSRWKLYSVLVRDITSLHDTSSPPSTTVLPESWAVLALHGPRPLVPYIKALNEQDLRYSKISFGSVAASILLHYDKLRTRNGQPRSRARPSSGCSRRAFSVLEEAARQLGLRLPPVCRSHGSSTAHLSLSEFSCVLLYATCHRASTSPPHSGPSAPSLPWKSSTSPYPALTTLRSGNHSSPNRTATTSRSFAL